MKLKMIVEIDYEDNGVTRNYLKTNLIEWFDKAVGEGLLTGPSDAEVNEWDIRVEEVDCDEVDT